MKPAARGKRTGFGVGPTGAGAPFTLAVDIGGTRIKASVLDRAGKMVAPRVEVNTPAAPKPAEKVDRADGKLDGKLDRKSGAIDCPTCKRRILRSAVVCAWCGKRLSSGDAFHAT